MVLMRRLEGFRQFIHGQRMLPIMPFTNGSTPWHSSQYTALPEIYTQDASLEIAWSCIALEQNTIAGQSIVPFISQGLEGFDINEPEDWILAEHYLASGRARLPDISHKPFNLSWELSNKVKLSLKLFVLKSKRSF